MSYKEWQEVAMQEVIQFNPTESIRKGTTGKKIGMDKLNTFQRKIEGYEITEFKSGTKFRNGDTLLARITPCLENGKTAQVSILEENEIGFGSTEFIVLREKEGLSVNDYIYYLSISPKIRDIAIKSMTGTSGRQRAQVDVIKNEKIKIPNVTEQKAIANILSSLDEKIEVNNQINKKLEEMAQTIFKQWFVDFEFPNEEGKPYKSSGGRFKESNIGLIPSIWNSTKLESFCEITSSKRIFRKDYVLEGIPFYRSKEVIERSKGKMVSTELFISDTLYNQIEKKYGIPQSGDILLTSVGTLGIPLLINDEKFYFKDGNLTWFKGFKHRHLNLFVYNWLLSKEGQDSLDQITIGSTQKALTITSLKKLNIIEPSEAYLKQFNSVVESIFNKKHAIELQNNKLISIRDILLPKLMSGEIRVPIEKE
ncbi:restriction endonuclease subunit S [Bacillus sp. Hm123]|uniref:restriction endonuclease subunit S n=1 Tax=Bacillus sp. Hm123 TaxID=3450745 RepID=UPI003F43E308